MEIKKQLTKTTKCFAGKNGKKFIVVHQTGNTSKGADAQAHANLQKNGNVRSASWHVSVDDKEAIQSIDYDVQCWHAGDGRGEGNLNGIAVELCINSDGDYVKTVHNGAKVVAQLLKEHKLPVSAVKQHNNFSGKNCPAQIRANKAGINWNDFINLVKNALVGSKPKKATKHVVQRGDTFSEIAVLHGLTTEQVMSYNPRVKPTELVIGDVIHLVPVPGVKVAPKPVPAKPKKVFTKALGETSLVDFLKANGVDSSYANRKKLASENGVKSYRGTASQNETLLEKLKKK